MTWPEREYRESLLRAEVITARKQLGLAPTWDIEAGAPMTAAEREAAAAVARALEPYLTATREGIAQFGTELFAALAPVMASWNASCAAIAAAFARMGEWQDNYGRETGPGRERA